MSVRTTPNAAVFDVGNTTIFCGIVRDNRVVRSFRVPIGELDSAAAFRVIAGRLRTRPDRAAFSSVVPELTRRVATQLRRTLEVEPRQLTAAAVRGMLDIRYRRRAELGTDRIACALGARVLFPERDVIVVDCGTATTVTAVDRHGTLHGGAILPGAGLWGDALARRTARLPLVKPRRIAGPVGRSARESIASGIYFGHLGAMRELVLRIGRTLFPGAAPVVLGTGGHAPLFEGENLFTKIEPGLILVGLGAFALTS